MKNTLVKIKPVQSVGAFLMAMVLASCGGPSAGVQSPADIAIVTGHAMVETLCEEGFKKAITEADLLKAKEQCEILKISYQAFVAGVEGWNSATAPSASSLVSSATPSTAPLPSVAPSAAPVTP